MTNETAIPEVGDIINILSPTPEELEQAQRLHDDPTSDGMLDVHVAQMVVMDVREPGFYVVTPRDEGNLRDPAARAYSKMMGGKLKVTGHWRPTDPDYEADAWIQVDDGAPERRRIVKLLKRIDLGGQEIYAREVEERSRDDGTL